jgi:hypothetical protein
MGSSPNEDTNHAIGIGISGTRRRRDHAWRLLLLSRSVRWWPPRRGLWAAARLQRTRSAAAGRVRPAAGRTGRRRASCGAGIRSAATGAGLRPATSRSGLRPATSRSGLWTAAAGVPVRATARQPSLCGASGLFAGMVRCPPPQVPQTPEKGGPRSRVLRATPGARAGLWTAARSELPASTAMSLKSVQAAL